MTDQPDPPKRPRPPETTELQDGHPLPEEITGRASGTSDSLSTLFDNDGADHFADGFRGGSNSDPQSDVDDEETPPQTDADEDVTAD